MHARRVVTLAVAISLAVCAGATAAPAPEPFGTNDAGGFRNIAPGGQNGHADAAQTAAFLGTGALPPHTDDQLAPYTNLISASPTLDPARIGEFFKDATFGVPEGEVEHEYSPRDDVTIQRDRGFGVPHVYGSDRDGTMFGAGYVGSEDRLFLMDVLRHLGRADLSSFIGGSEGNRAMDREQWRIAPYTEEDLQLQFDRFDDLYGADGAQIQADVTSYVAGINKYICEATPVNPECLARGVSPTPTTGSKNGDTPVQKLPGAYAAITPNGDPAVEPELFSVTDVIATASLVGGIFGKGGGRELDAALVLDEAVARFGADGNKVFDDFRRAEDPEAPVTTPGTFPYRVPNGSPEGDSVGRPDVGSFDPTEVVESPGVAGLPGGLLGPLSGLDGSASNALLVSGAESESGRPVAVIGPQTGYFSPQILMEIDLHAPAVDGKPGIDARGSSFPGVNLYVQLGRGRDYAWSATSAGQDIIDTFALDLCDPDPAAGSPPGLEDFRGYLYRGACEPFEELRRTNQWVPNGADMSPPGTETLLTRRTKLGLELARAEVGGTPVVYVQLRSTYMHEADSALGFLDFNTPGAMDTPAEFQQAASRIGFTFNWFFINRSDIAYYNSGNNPVRPAGTDPDFPVRACPTAATDRCKYEWEGWNPDLFTASYTPVAEHPQGVNKPYYTSWNNKQAAGYSAADDNFAYGSIHRSEPLDDRIVPRIAGEEKITASELTDAMEDAGTVDLRGDKVLPFLLQLLSEEADPVLRDALTKLEAWRAAGAHRRDDNGDGVYEHSEAIKIMDAWWPELVKAQFGPALGEDPEVDDDLYDRLVGMIQIDNPPHTRQGSAYISGWYAYVEKDLRAILSGQAAGAAQVQGGFSRRYCGASDPAGTTSRAECERVMRTTLQAAIARPREAVYTDPDDTQCDEADNAAMDDQVCFDAIEYSAIGAVSLPLQRWQNRPTFQQVVEVAAEAVPQEDVGATPRRRVRLKPEAAPDAKPRERPKLDPGAGVRVATDAGELPFTGFAVALVALLGLLLVGGGVALRRIRCASK